MSKASLGVLEPLELREYLVKREIWAHLDLMEIRYVNIYCIPPPSAPKETLICYGSNSCSLLLFYMYYRVLMVKSE